MIGVRLITLALLLLPGTVAAQFHDAPRTNEFYRLFQQCEANGNADACRRALGHRMDPQTRDRLQQALYNIERRQQLTEQFRGLNAELDQLLASCRTGTLSACDQADRLPLSAKGRERIESARRQANMLAAQEANKQHWARVQADYAARSKAKREQQEAAALGVGLSQPSNRWFYQHATYDSLCRGANYTVTVAWVAPESTCTTCYRADVRCADGSTHSVASTVSPFSTKIDGVLYHHNAALQWLAIFTFAAIGWISYKPQRNPLFLMAGGAVALLLIVILSQLTYATSLPGRGWYGFGSFFFWVTTLVVLPLALTLFAKPFFVGCDYLFVHHPAERVVADALKQGKPIDEAALAAAMAPDVTTLHDPPPVYRSENQAARARALREKLEADQKLAEEAIRREEARVREKEWTS